MDNLIGSIIMKASKSIPNKSFQSIFFQMFKDQIDQHENTFCKVNIIFVLKKYTIKGDQNSFI